MAKFNYRGTSLAFVCSHLAAHEGRLKCNRRNEDAAMIQQGARLGLDKTIDIGNQFDHVFWAGDFMQLRAYQYIGKTELKLVGR